MIEHWYISDHHLWHTNIIQYAGRPFTNVEEMNEALVTYHNELVKPQDHVSFLGDFTLLRSSRDKARVAKELAKYNGHKRLYLGNHDHFSVQFYLDIGFEKVYATWRTNDGLLCSHIPIHPRSLGTAKANVHGHIHNAPDYEPVVVSDRIVPYVNVCVEVTGYKPLNREQLLEGIKSVNRK